MNILRNDLMWTNKYDLCYNIKVVCNESLCDIQRVMR